MEKKQNGYFKAVSIISLVYAICLCVLFVFVFVAALTDFQFFMESFEQIVIAETGGVPGVEVEQILLSAQSSAVIVLILFGVLIGGSAAVCYLAYFKLKKYSELTNEEAALYNSRIIVWIVVMFVCSGFIMGLLMLLGYINITKVQIDEFNGVKAKPQAEESTETETIKTNNSVDLDKMMERLEKLQKVKDMGGLTDEEYEELKKSIIDGKE